MAYDGFCIGRIVKEYNDILIDGKISKIIEPAAHEIILIVKNNKESVNLLCSANPAVPYTFLIEGKPEAPITAPNFCMVLRKYISNGKIVKIYQTGNERIITFEIEHMNEMGDKSVKKLILELMGKYSNIILTDEDDIIIDCIKHVNSLTSSVREVLPGRKYFVPTEITKISPYDEKGEISADYLCRCIYGLVSADKIGKSSVANVLSKEFEGVSKVCALEIVQRAQFDSSISFDSLNNEDIKHISEAFAHILSDMNGSNCVYFYYDDDKQPVEYALSDYETLNEKYTVEAKDNLSKSLSLFYENKQQRTTNVQKSGEMLKFVKNILDKDKNKTEVWKSDLKECENKEELRIKGELLKAYAYMLKPASKVTVDNYYTNEPLEIELDEQLSIIENSNKYYKMYNKAKRCEAAVGSLLEYTLSEMSYLEEIMHFLTLAENASDIDEIKAELAEKGFLKKKNIKLAKKGKLKPKHYLYNGYHIYVGKNNIQNEELTFKTAVGNDWWFHAKGIPGSHVIVKSDKDNPATEWDMPNDVFEAAGALAAYNSKHEGSGKVEIDYTRKKHIKKPVDGNKGMVIYHTYYSMVADGDVKRFNLTTII